MFSALQLSKIFLNFDSLEKRIIKDIDTKNTNLDVLLVRNTFNERLWYAVITFMNSWSYLHDIINTIQYTILILLLYLLYYFYIKQ